MKTYKFVPYFTGQPLERVEYSYDETHMFQTIGDTVLSAKITEEQLSHLNSLAPDNQMMAALIFADASRPVG